MDLLSSIIISTLIGAVVVAYLWTGVWAYRDAEKRRKSPLLVALLVMLVAWPIGLLVWFAVRPEKGPPPFNLDDYRVQ